jgi:hypothetical protein
LTIIDGSDAILAPILPKVDSLSLIQIKIFLPGLNRVDCRIRIAHVSKRRAGSACYDASNSCPHKSECPASLQYQTGPRWDDICATMMSLGLGNREYCKRSGTSTREFQQNRLWSLSLTEQKEKVEVVLAQSCSEIVSTARVSSEIASVPCRGTNRTTKTFVGVSRGKHLRPGDVLS